MLHKEFKRARREWNKITDDHAEAMPRKDWALEYARPLINEVQRLRDELKLRNKKKRAVHARLSHEQDDHDELIEEIELLRDWVLKAPSDANFRTSVANRLDKILEVYQDD